MTDHFITGEGFPRVPKFEIPDDWESHFHFPDVTASPAFREFQGYCQADIDMTLHLYDVLPKPEPRSFTDTIIVTGPFAFSTSQEEAVEDWLLSKGYFIGWHDTVRVVTGSNRSRMLSHLRMTGARIYSVTTRVEVL